MPNNQTEAPTDTIFDAWFTELESEQVDKPKDSDSLYKGWLTPVPDEWIPDWIKDGYNNSIEGLAQQILKCWLTSDRHLYHLYNRLIFFP